MLDRLSRFFRPTRAVSPVHRNGDTALTLEQTATEHRFTSPYRPSYDFGGLFVDDEHAGIDTAPRHPWGMIDVGIEGWLLPADALKLYEMAYFATGDILELGSYRGLSTSILARALARSGRPSSIVTVDLDAVAADAGPANLERQKIPGRDRVRFVTGDAIAYTADLARQGHRYPFAFVDHSHRYEHVLPTCQQLHDVIEPGGFVLFHDYNDPRNADPADADYGVFQGVTDGLAAGFFEAWGVFGCTGLFRRRLAV